MYRAKSARILEELKKIYSDDDLNVTIFGFEAGSVIVKFRWLENKRGGFICKFTFRRHTGSSKIKGAKLEFQTGGQVFLLEPVHTQFYGPSSQWCVEFHTFLRRA